MKKAVSLRELNESEVRGVLNVSYDEVKNGAAMHGGNDPELGVFMVSNQDFVKNTNEEFDYMDELDSAPWYRGCISRAKAEDILNDRVPEGTFIVRSGIKDGEFYISAKASCAKYCHIEVNRCGDSFVAVCGPTAEPRAFGSFENLLDYLKTNPTQFDGENGGQVILKEFLERKCN